jgi:hypothetical protein
MNKLLLEKELIRQLQLINFDRSKTLMEQIKKSKTPSTTPPPITDFIPGYDPNAFGGDKLLTKCPSGYEPLSKSEVESLSKQINNPLNSTLNNNYIRLEDGTYCRRLSESGQADLENAMNELAGVAHVALPVLGVIATIATGGIAGFVISAVFELADATVYYAEGRYVEAGVAAICAILPWDFLVKYTSLKRLGKEGLKELTAKLSKEGSSTVLTEIEKQSLKDLGSESVEKELIYEITKQSLKLTLKQSSLGKFLNLLWVLVRGGFIVVDFLKTPVFLVVGVYMTWEHLLIKYGIIKKEDIEELETTKPKEDIVLDETVNISQELKSIFANLGGKGEVYSIKIKDTYSLNVLLIQLFLKNSGTWDETNGTQIQVKNKKIIVSNNLLLSKVELFTTMGTLVKSLKVKGIKDTSSSFVWPYDKLDSNQPMILKITDINGTTELKKIFYNASWFYGGAVSTGLVMKWGYFDKSTQQAVLAFQNQNGLDMDGIVGKSTFLKMAELINSSMNINNNSGKNIKTKDLMDRLLTKEQIEKTVNEKKITIEQIEEVYENNKTQIQDSIMNVLDTKTNGEELLKTIGDTLQIIKFN